MRRALLATSVAALSAACGSLLGVSDDGDTVVEQTKTDAAVDGASGIGQDGDTTTSTSGDAATGIDAGDASDGAAPRTQRVVFVTTGARTGDFGSVAIADGLCNTEAKAAGLTGPGFVAWLSVDGNAAVSAKARLVGTAPWYLVNDGGRVFAGPDAIVNGSFPEHGIATNAKGGSVSGTAWTNTRQDGTSYQSDCAQWSDTAQAGVVGILGATNETWTGSSPESCGSPRHFICFER